MQLAVLKETQDRTPGHGDTVPTVFAVLAPPLDLVMPPLNPSGGGGMPMRHGAVVAVCCPSFNSKKAARFLLLPKSPDTQLLQDFLTPPPVPLHGEAESPLHQVHKEWLVSGPSQVHTRWENMHATFEWVCGAHAGARIKAVTAPSPPAQER